MESQYINSRPFRVNAGAVHAYVQAPSGKTAYLSELKSGAEVLVADAAGRAKTAVVGRCKIETRPMVSTAGRGLLAAVFCIDGRLCETLCCSSPAYNTVLVVLESPTLAKGLQERLLEAVQP
jgi:hypothetical protein